MQQTGLPYLNQTRKAAPLAVFRFFFGIMMLISIIRFWGNGWIQKLYIEPTFFFSYYGFEWVRPLGEGTYILFVLCGLSAFAVAIGYRYQASIIIFFFFFTYIELMDKTTYLNHYYFISILSFLMIFLPAGRTFSIDGLRQGEINYVPRWSIDSLRLLLSMVYFYAGLAKLNSDWLLKSMPLKIWLPSRYDIPFLGDFLHQDWVIYAFSWGGALYDLSIPFLLFWQRTRVFAFILVLVFHLLTRVLFPIGMFPYIMIVSALIFFDDRFHENILQKARKVLIIVNKKVNILPFFWRRKEKKLNIRATIPQWKMSLVAAFLAIQFLLPWRYLLYPGELFWTEQGFRFSWRVMLMDKTGYAQFKIVVPEDGKTFYVNNSDFLTPFQEKQMSFQPDFILEYAHHLRDYYALNDKDIEVYVDCHVALNGRRSQRYIDPKINLAKEQESFKPKSWILPFNDEIKGI